MKLSLLTFSFMGDVLTHRMDAETLCRIAKENGIEELDLQEAELRLYGVKAFLSGSGALHCQSGKGLQGL